MSQKKNIHERHWERGQVGVTGHWGTRLLFMTSVTGSLSVQNWMLEPTLTTGQELPELTLLATLLEGPGVKAQVKK